MSKEEKTEEPVVQESAIESVGSKLDALFQRMKGELFNLNYNEVSQDLEKAKALMEEGGDWDRKNRLKVYQGLYCMSVRDFKQAADLFLDTISTFTCYELCDYKTFIGYTVISAMLALPRVELRSKVIKGSGILEVLHDLPDIQVYLFSLYNCQYSKFFEKLAWLESYLKTDRYLAPHYRYYVREMKILAYAQLIGSYRSLSLTYMSQTFGVSKDFIESELAKFIAAGRLHCKIDKVRGIVETNRPDSKNDQYQRCIKQGDILLNRIQKLSRVINI